ncbi:MAG: hypothetical protein U7127_31105 (plasmid) [Phormidium sp.]
MQILNEKIIVSPKLVRLVQIFHFSLAIFLLIGTLLLNGCSSNSVAAVPLNWKSIDSVPSALSQLAISQNTSLIPNHLNNVLAASIPTKDNGYLHIFNFNHPQTCGKIGCLYVAYLAKKQSYQQVLSTYLQPNLPPQHSLISISPDISATALPCLEIKQVKQQSLVTLTYCFNGSSFQPTKSIRTLLSKS